MFCFDVDVEVGVEFVAQHHLEKAKTVCWKPIEIFSYFVLTWSSFSYLFFPSVILSNQRCGYRRFIRSTLWSGETNKEKRLLFGRTLTRWKIFPTCTSYWLLHPHVRALNDGQLERSYRRFATSLGVVFEWTQGGSDCNILTPPSRKEILPTAAFEFELLNSAHRCLASCKIRCWSLRAQSWSLQTSYSRTRDKEMAKCPSVEVKKKKIE